MKRHTVKKEWIQDFNYSVTLGRTYTKFMEGLKEKKFLGNKCGGRTFYPPKPFCDKSFELPSEWLECDGTGTVEAFTVCYQKANAVVYPGSKMLPQPPYVVGVIKVNKSDHCLIHYLAGFDTKDPKELPEKIQVGMKVRPVWSKDRAGNILDIKYFEPIE